MAKPKFLYKYRPFGEFVIGELAEQQVYYCDPRQFNDPFDCRPLLAVDIDLRSLEKFAFQLLKKERPEEDNWAASRIYRYRYNAGEFGSYDDGGEGGRDYKRSLLGVIETDLEAAMSGIGVLSLSEKWDSMLMWSHYAGSHKGVCLEFEFANNRCDNLRQVDYTSMRGISVKDLYLWRLRGDAFAEQRVRERYLFSKSRHWKYEAEWRAICSPAGSAASPFILRSIYFGARCPSSIITTIVKLFSGSQINPQFYELYLDNEKARLRRRLVDTSYLDAFGVQKSDIFRTQEFLAMLENLDDLEEPVPQG